MEDKTAVLICNGPSLRSVPNSWLDKYYTFGSNRVWLKYSPKHLTVVDVKMVHNKKLQLEMVEGMKGSELVTFSVDAAKLMQPHFPGGFPENVSVLEWWNYYNEDGGKLLPVFAQKEGEPLVSGGTVTYGMLQLAWRRGFKNILIVGMNHTFRDPRGDHMDPRYNVDVGIPYEIENMDPKKVGRGAGKWFWSEENFVKKTNMFYAVAKAFYEKHGGTIINCTPDSLCPVFEKNDWRNY